MRKAVKFFSKKDASIEKNSIFVAINDNSFGIINAAEKLTGCIASVSKAGVVQNRYLYTAEGLRVQKNTASNALAERYHYDLDDRLIAITNATGGIVAEYIYLGDTLIAEVSSGGTVGYVHTDHLDTPQKLTNASGTIANDYRWQPFGTSLSASNNYRIKFPGQEFDAESSLYHNYHRYYDPSLGRYVEADPIGLEGGWNKYAYVEGRPIVGSDKYGLILETPLDAGMVVYDLWQGNYEDAATSAVALCLPGVPAGVSKIDDAWKIWKKWQKNRTPALPDSAWNKKAPNQVTPGAKVREHYKYNSKTNEYERSDVHYDEYGRQKARTDYTNHGRAKDHTNPHHHTTDYDYKGYQPFGKGSSPKPGSYNED